MTKRKRLTPKQRVLRRYPKAVAKQWSVVGEGVLWIIERDMSFENSPLGKATTSVAAWANAASKLRRVGGGSAQ